MLVQLAERGAAPRPRPGQLDLDGLVTRTYDLDGVNDGYDDMREGRNIRGVMVYE